MEILYQMGLKIANSVEKCKLCSCVVVRVM